MRYFYAALFALCGFIFSFTSRAEYRVFELVISDQTAGASRTVTSTLDDIQYPGYYPLKTNETIAIRETWMCWGRQGEHVKPCPNPRAGGLP